MKETMQEIKKIAILRALQLGDMMCAIPAVRCLKATYPSADIVLLGLPWAESFVKRFREYFSGFIHFPGFPGLPEQPFNEKVFNEFVERMQQQKFDLVIQMQGNGTVVNDLLPMLGAKNTAGFYNQYSKVESPFFMHYPETGMEKERHLMLMKFLGCTVISTALEFPLYEDDRRDFDKFSAMLNKEKYVCVHPGSRGAWRQWEPAYFAETANYCASQGYQVVVTGTESERSITKNVISHMNHPALDLTGKTGIGAAALLIKHASLLIANCTGVSHIADAMKTRSVIISMDGEPDRWAPENKMLHYVHDWTVNKNFKAVMDKIKTVIEAEKEVAI